MAERDLPTAALLRQLLDYNPETGDLIWRTREITHFAHHTPARAIWTMKSWNSGNAGKLAGRTGVEGYRTLKISPWGEMQAHRVIWCIYTGDWPQCVIDHINGNPGDNRIENLRDVSQVGNQRNRKYNPNRAASGAVGVYKSPTPRRYVARLWLKDKVHYFGTFDTVEEAKAVIQRERKLMGFTDRF
jgi:hypothetical protein